MLINAIVQTLQQMSQYANQVKVMIPQMKSMVGVEDVNAVIRHDGKNIVVGVKFTLINEELAEKWYNEILERLGLKPPSKEKHT